MEDEFVYSTEEGDLRKQKSHKGKKRNSQPASDIFPKDGKVRVQREKKGRGGKTVSVIYGMPGSSDELKDWATRLKQKCGSGGSQKGDTIIIQGDQVDNIVSILKEAGFKATRAGG